MTLSSSKFDSATTMPVTPPICWALLNHEDGYWLSSIREAWFSRLTVWDHLGGAQHALLLADAARQLPVALFDGLGGSFRIGQSYCAS